MRRTILIENDSPVSFEEDEWPIVASAGKEDSDNFLVVRAKKDANRPRYYSFVVYGKSSSTSSITISPGLTDLMTTFFRQPLQAATPKSYGYYLPSTAGYLLKYSAKLIKKAAELLGSPELGQEALNSMAPRKI